MTDIRILIRALEAIGRDINDESASLVIIEAADRLKELQGSDTRIPGEPMHQVVSTPRVFLFA